ncbi:hypothetical protein XW81_01405 [Buchnera aphidicola (Schlechtendalia chinensis)]|uniref:Peptidoglycan-associated lipoprotein n=1 Tax=Buchnera aphidicola subsp. Schlechtendalia chinensis TaxID=118110 RepID=A0A172WDM1_BUCSC|nr:peptidoglycan-associated lipoprotein Pal [Buchnera aphidicola]ANF17061.1 hypothetical protein XW81_01405 [Buchnera aphidicola (Schlechtendalia chinensis)]
MKLNKIIKIVILTIPIITAFSCSFQKNKAEKNSYNQNSPTENVQIDSSIPVQSDVSKEKGIVYFDLNKSNINSKFSQILNETVTFLYENPEINVVIEGHADKRGTDKYNIELGKRRANSVKLYLESKGVPSKQISIISYGSTKPVEVGETEDAYSKNRRAVIVY